MDAVFSRNPAPPFVVTAQAVQQVLYRLLSVRDDSKASTDLCRGLLDAFESAGEAELDRVDNTTWLEIVPQNVRLIAKTPLGAWAWVCRRTNSDTAMRFLRVLMRTGCGTKHALARECPCDLFSAALQRSVKLAKALREHLPLTHPICDGITSDGTPCGKLLVSETCMPLLACGEQRGVRP
jgi:hypothetical protein